MIETVKQLLIQDWLYPFYGMAFWWVINLFFPGLNPVVQGIIKAIDQAPMDNEQITTTAENLAKEKLTVIFKKLASKYLGLKLGSK